MLINQSAYVFYCAHVWGLKQASKQGHLSNIFQTFNCTEEVLAIVALLSVDTVFFTPHDHKEKAVGCWQKFRSPDGDHLTLLNVYKAYQSVKGNKVWCACNSLWT